MTDGDPAAVARPKLPVWRTIKESFIFVFGNFGHFLALGWLPFTVTFAAGFVVIAEMVGYLTVSSAISIPIRALSWFAYAVFAVRWHRFVLLDERGAALSGLLEWRNFIFFGYILVLMGVPVFAMNSMSTFGTLSEGDPAMTFVTLIGYLVLSLGGFALSLILYRLYLLFPATAIDRPMKFGQAWQRMGGNTWRLIGATYFVVVIIMILAFSLSFSLMQMATEYASAKASGVPFEASFPISAILLPLPYFFMGAVLVTILSLTYRLIIGAPESGETAAGATPVS